VKAHWSGLLTALVLAACAGTPQPSDTGPKRQAAEVNTSLGREYLQRGQYEIALDKLKKALAADPNYAPAHTVIAVLYERLGETELAGKHYREAIDARPQNGDVNNNYGVYLCSRGKNEAAEPYFLKAVKDPFYSTPEVAYANAGSCMSDSKNFTIAEKYLRKSLDINPTFPDALIAMSSIKYELADYMAARAFLQRFEANAAQNPESLLLGLRIERRLGDRKTAQQYESILLRKFPDSAEAASARGEQP